MPKADNEPCAKDLKLCELAERYPDVINYWMSPLSGGVWLVRNAPRYDWLAWILPLDGVEPSDEDGEAV